MPFAGTIHPKNPVQRIWIEYRDWPQIERIEDSEKRRSDTEPECDGGHHRQGKSG